jgi:hypothetical protein
MVFVHIARNELEAARVRLREALESAHQLATPPFMAKAIAAAVSLWQFSGDYERAALWAGVLLDYTQNLHPSLFDMSVYEQLETELGTERYHQVLEQSKSLTLNAALIQVEGLLNHTSEG